MLPTTLVATRLAAFRQDETPLDHPVDFAGRNLKRLKAVHALAELGCTAWVVHVRERSLVNRARPGVIRRQLHRPVEIEVLIRESAEVRVENPLHPRNVLRTLHEIFETAALPRMRFHDLRHSAASLLIASGVELVEVSMLLGHSEIRVTADLYSHLAAQTAAKAARHMDAVLGG